MSEYVEFVLTADHSWETREYNEEWDTWGDVTEVLKMGILHGFCYSTAMEIISVASKSQPVFKKVGHVEGKDLFVMVYNPPQKEENFCFVCDHSPCECSEYAKEQRKLVQEIEDEERRHELEDQY